MGIFNKQKLIDNWKFEVVIDKQELLDHLKLPINSGTLKNTIVNFGQALGVAQRRLEPFIFASYEDGRLVTKKRADGAITHVEIDFFELGNISGLTVLETLFTIIQRGPIRQSVFFNSVAPQFRIHGHHKDRPEAITMLGFDQSGLFLADRRDAWNAKREEKELQLP